MPALDATAPTVQLEIDQGDDETITLSRRAADDTPLDISGYTFHLTIKRDESDPDQEAVLQKEVTTHTEPVNGETELTLSASETAALEGSYHYEVREETSAGVWNTLFGGRLWVRVGATTSGTASSSGGGTIGVTIADAAAGIDVSVASGHPDAVTVTSVVSDGRLLVAQTVADGETLEIPAGYGQTVAGPMTVDGTAIVDGTLTVAPGPISGAGSISGDGHVHIP
jgi:hypothetical protein